MGLGGYARSGQGKTSVSKSGHARSGNVEKTASGDVEKLGMAAPPPEAEQGMGGPGTDGATATGETPLQAPGADGPQGPGDGQQGPGDAPPPSPMTPPGVAPLAVPEAGAPGTPMPGGPAPGAPAPGMDGAGGAPQLPPGVTPEQAMAVGAAVLSAVGPGALPPGAGPTPGAGPMTPGAGPMTPGAGPMTPGTTPPKTPSAGPMAYAGPPMAKDGNGPFTGAATPFGRGTTPEGGATTHGDGTTDSGGTLTAATKARTGSGFISKADRARGGVEKTLLGDSNQGPRGIPEAGKVDMGAFARGGNPEMLPKVVGIETGEQSFGPEVVGPIARGGGVIFGPGVIRTYANPKDPSPKESDQYKSTPPPPQTQPIGVKPPKA